MTPNTTYNHAAEATIRAECGLDAAMAYAWSKRGDPEPEPLSEGELAEAARAARSAAGRLGRRRRLEKLAVKWAAAKAEEEVRR